MFEPDDFGSFGGLVYNDVNIKDCNVIISGIPYESATSGKKGTSDAPTIIRLLSKDMQTMSRYGEDLNQMVLLDVGNVSVYPLEPNKTRDSIEEAYDYLFSKSKATVITIGGDHSSTYPVIKSLSKKGKVAIVWFDAHRDVLGELIGSKYSHGSPLRRAIELDNVDPKNILLMGTRYMEPEEQKFVEQNEINELRMVDLEDNNYSLDKFVELMKKITVDVDHVYVSIDIDVLDPGFAPGTGTPVSGGMSPNQLMRYIKAIPVKIRAFDLMEISPPLDRSEITSKAALGLISEILAKIKLQD